MGSKHKLITVPLDVLEAALEELPEGSAAAVRILKALEEIPSTEPVAYLAQRRDGKQGGRFLPRSLGAITIPSSTEALSQCTKGLSGDGAGWSVASGKPL